MRNLAIALSHAGFGAACAAAAALATYGMLTGAGELAAPSAARAQQPSGQRTTDVLTQPMAELAREMRIRVIERDPGNGSPPHRHPGHHTFGYVLEGSYEIKVDDGPVRRLNAGDYFYEPPGALHAVSRNPSTEKPVRYLVIQVADPSKPITVPE